MAVIRTSFFLHSGSISEPYEEASSMMEYREQWIGEVGNLAYRGSGDVMEYREQWIGEVGNLAYRWTVNDVVTVHIPFSNVATMSAFCLGISRCIW